MVTGNFGNDGRAMIFQRADVATPGDMGGWRVSIIANREIEQAIGRFFPPDTQKKIRRASQSMGSGWELTVDFVEPPPFIKPLIELEGEK